MDKNLVIQEIQALEIGLDIFNATDTLKFEDLKPHQISILNQTHSAFLKYYPESVSAITDLPSFFYFVQSSTSTKEKIKKRITELKKETGNETKDLRKETNSIPSEIETMVALYKEHQASLLETENKKDSVAEIVKRARKSWEEREKQRLIYQNSESERQEKTDQFYRQYVDSKKGNQQTVLNNTYKLAKIALIAQGANKLSSDKLHKAVENLVYLAETGAIDIENYKELNVASYLAVKEELKLQNKILDDIDNLVQKKQRLEEVDTYSDEIDNLEAKINQLNQNAELSTDKGYLNRLLDVNKDEGETYEDTIDKAKTEIDNNITKLSEAVPNAKLKTLKPDSSRKIEELESIIRKTDPTLLNINPTGLGARTSATLKETGSNSLNPGIVDLYSKGLTKEKFDKLTEDKNSPVSKYLSKDPTLRKQIENGLRKYSKSPDGIKTGEELQSVKHLSSFEAKLPTSVQKVLHPVKSIEAAINKQIGKYAGSKINKIFGKSIGEKFEKYVLADGLKIGAKKFANEVAKKAILTLAKKAGASAAKTAAILASESAIAAASAALGISTAGLSLVIEAAIYIGWKIVSFGYDRFKEIYKYIWGEDFDPKEAAKIFTIGGIALASSFTVVKNGLRGVAIATQMAVISALGIIWLSLAVIAVFLTLTFLTAPILTTLVQFDAIEKVKYGEMVKPPTPTNCSNMAWPFEGTHTITQGPRQATTSCTHGGGISESVDFSIMTGTEILSISDGVVSAVGDDGPDKGYGKYIKIDAKTDDGKEFTIVYGHLAEQFVKNGDTVKAKQKIGISNNTGYSTGPHLHLGYIGIEYNSCPAGGFKVNENCCDTSSCNQP